MTSKNRQLEKQLAEKEELVSALTAQLEQAAERLDRIQRSGSDRGYVDGTSHDRQVGNNTQTVLTKVDQFVDDWNECEAPETLGRIESQLQEIQSLLKNSTPIAIPQPVGQQDNSEPNEQQGLDAWAAMKSSLLGESESAEYNPDSYTEQSDEASDNEQVVEQVSEEVVEKEFELDLADPPDPVAEENKDVEELHFAIDCRDDYITSIVHQMRELHRKSMRTTPVNWDELLDQPEEIRTQIEYLEAQLNEQLRFAEIEQSVQRAQLARKELRLKQLEDRLKDKLVKMGMDPELLNCLDEFPDRLLKQEEEEEKPAEEQCKETSLLRSLFSSEK